ncbi:MATE family efflux transporter, partial [Bittarella massiliensis]|nr:MATE family efflux transporter [Bittarella massiliensis (ex Durand et al. 2017)]
MMRKNSGVLDIVFIVNFGMGVAGAAWATVIAQVLSGLLCLLYIFRRFAILRLHREDWAWRGRFAWEHLRIATPMAFQFCIIAVGSIVVQGVLNGFGSTTVA